jgi:hypothetical protein
MMAGGENFLRRSSREGTNHANISIQIISLEPEAATM